MHRPVDWGVVIGLLVIISLLLSGCGTSLPTDSASASSLPENAAKDYNKAESWRYAQRCDLAIPLYLRAIAKNGMYVHAYDGLGACYQMLGSFNAAIAEYDKAIAIDPQNYGLYIDRAGAEANNGSTGAAASDDSLALQLAPKQSLAYSSIADSFASYADFADAITAMTKAIALQPNDPTLYKKRAGIYLQMHDNAHVYADYNRAIEAAPYTAARAGIYSDLAGVYDSQGDYVSAYKAIDAAIALQPNNPAFYLTSGGIRQDAGDLTSSLKLYGQVFRLEKAGPDVESAHESKGDVLVKLGQTKDALAEYRLAEKFTAKGDQVTLPRLKSKIKSLQSGTGT